MMCYYPLTLMMTTFIKDMLSLAFYNINLLNYAVDIVLYTANFVEVVILSASSLENSRYPMLLIGCNCLSCLYSVKVMVGRCQTMNISQIGHPKLKSKEVPPKENKNKREKEERRQMRKKKKKKEEEKK